MPNEIFSLDATKNSTKQKKRTIPKWLGLYPVSPMRHRLP